MDWLKSPWDQNYPDETRVSIQILRDNDARFNKDVNMHEGSVIEQAREHTIRTNYVLRENKYLSCNVST